MTYKICQVIFSTNRIEYLSRTLAAQRFLDFSGCQVDRIFIDDFPKGRNNTLVETLVRSFGYTELYLHPENLGLSVTWTEFWNLIRDRDYDYVWHQEDDVEILETVQISDLVRLLESNPGLSQAVLKRQPWYFHESESTALDTDQIFENYRYEMDSYIFSPMASLYSMDRVRYDYSQWYRDNLPDDTELHNINLNEGMIGKVWLMGHGQHSAHVKNSQGHNLINHIGEYFVGRRILPNEPNAHLFAHFDPETRYNSRDGSQYD